MSTSIHKQNDIADFVKDCILRILPDGGKIYDPTCGSINRQFRKYFTGSCTYLDNYYYVGKDLIYGNDVFKETIQEPYVDIVWYDPPFIPTAKFDNRFRDYGTEQITVDEIKNYFSIPVIKNLLTFTKKYLAIRGMDFYYPINSFNYFSFYELCIKNILAQTELNLFCQYIMPYTRHDIDKIILINKRPIINYSYTVIFMKGNFEN